MKVFFTTLEYGARIVSMVLVVIGFMASGCVGCSYLVGLAVEDPMPGGSAAVFVATSPLVAGVFLYILSGVFKALAEE